MGENRRRSPFSEAFESKGFNVRLSVSLLLLLSV